MTFGAVLHKELLWDFSFRVLGHGIITSKKKPMDNDTDISTHFMTRTAGLRPGYG